MIFHDEILEAILSMTYLLTELSSLHISIYLEFHGVTYLITLVWVDVDQLLSNSQNRHYMYQKICDCQPRYINFHEPPVST